jgi:hypothetical protein
MVAAAQKRLQFHPWKLIQGKERYDPKNLIQEMNSFRVLLTDGRAGRLESFQFEDHPEPHLITMILLFILS